MHKQESGLVFPFQSDRDTQDRSQQVINKATTAAETKAQTNTSTQLSVY